MRLALLALLALVTASVASADRRPNDSHRRSFVPDAGLYVRRKVCTTAPAPAAPIIKKLKSPKARLMLRVTGAGSLCDAQWTSTRTGARYTDIGLIATPNVDAPSLCGTCTIDLLVTRLGRGDYQVTLGPTTIKAHAP